MVLSAEESSPVTASDDFVLNNGASITATVGSIAINAGDDINLNGNSTVHAPVGNVIITSAVGDNDGFDTQITISALINNGGTASATGGSANDTITISTKGTGNITLNGVAGNDAYTVNVGSLASAVLVADSGGGNDTLSIVGTAGNETFHVNDVDNGNTTINGNIPFVDNQTAVFGNLLGNQAEIIDYSNQQIETLNIIGGAGLEAFYVQPSKVVSGVNTIINVNGQAPVYTQPFTPGGSPLGPGDKLNLVVPPGGNFTVVANQIQFVDPIPTYNAGNGGYQSTIQFFNIETLDLNVPALPVDDTSVRRFDMNLTAAGNTAGYTSVLPGDIYTAGNGGFGWGNISGGTGVLGIDRGTPDSLLKDGHFATGTSNADTAARTFNADLGYQGYYLVSVTMGDAWFNHDTMRVTAENIQVLNNISSPAGGFAQNNFVVHVVDGTLNLVFEDIYPGLDTSWVVNAIEIRPAVLLTLGLIPYDSSNTLILNPVPGDGGSVDTITGVNATPNSLVTISTNLGTITTPDINAGYVGRQVLADVNGNFVFTVQRPNGSGIAVIEARAVDGSQTGFVSIEYTGVASRRFDFNAPGSPTQTPVQSGNVTDGYVSVLGNSAYSVSTGYGWDSLVSSFNRAGTTGDRADLRTDANFSPDTHTFRTAVTNGTYFVNITMGDATNFHDHMRVTAEGNTSPLGTDGLSSFADITTPAGQWFTDGFLVTVSDGVLDLGFSDIPVSVDPNWIINGLEIRPAGSVLGQLTLTGPTLASANGATDTYTGTGATPGSYVTVSTTLGTVQGDTNSAYQGVQVLADGNGTFTFSVVRPSFFDPTEPGGMGNTTAVIEALQVDGAKQGFVNGNVTYTYVSHAGTPTLSVTNTSGNEDTAIDLGSHINAALIDTDGSETLSLLISNVPVGATLSGSAQQRQWHLDRTGRLDQYPDDHAAGQQRRGLHAQHLCHRRRSGAASRPGHQRSAGPVGGRQRRGRRTESVGNSGFGQ